MKKAVLIFCLIAVTAFAGSVTPILNKWFTRAGVACDLPTFTSEFNAPGRISFSQDVIIQDGNGQNYDFQAMVSYTGVDCRQSGINPADGLNYVLDAQGNLTTTLFVPLIYAVYVNGPANDPWGYSGQRWQLNTVTLATAKAQIVVGAIQAKQPLGN